MAQDRLSIVNSALGMLGEQPIQSLDDGSLAGTTASRAYPVLMRSCLGSAPWTFAEKVVQLTADAKPARPDYAYSYERPMDHVVTRAVLEADMTILRVRWRISGRKICSDHAGIWLVYTFEAPEQDWLDDFTLAVTYGMAHHLAGAITESAAKVEGYLALMQQQLAIARGRDAQQHPPEALPMWSLVAWHTD